MLGCITPARFFNSFFTPKFLQEVVDLIQECMSSDPQRRPSAAQALRRLQQDAGDAAAA
jgi:serine/threonine protein kinase